MRNLFGPGLLMAVFVSTMAAAAPLETYGRLPFLEQAAISPDGALVAYAITDGEARTIVVKDLGTGKPIRAVNAGVRKVRGLQWAGSNHLIITESFTGAIPFVISDRAEWFLAIDYDVRKKTLRPLNSNLSEKVGDALNVVYGYPQVRIVGGRPLAFVMGLQFVADQSQVSLFKVDLDNQDLTTVADDGGPNVTDYLIDAEGRPQARAEYDGPQKQWLLKVWKSGWHLVRKDDAPIETPNLVGHGRDGVSVAVNFPNETHDQIREYSIAADHWGDPSPSPGRLVHDAASLRWIGQADLDGDETTYTFFDPNDQKIWRALAAAYPNDQVSLDSVSDDHRKFVLRVDSATDGPAFAIVDLTTGKGSWLGNEYDGLTTQDINPKQAVKFKAADGLDLSGYLTTPRGKPLKNLPLVVFPHGGPAARDTPGFDWWAQAMASQGYAVLQVNYRGSEGFGWPFQSAGFGQWGRKMQTDLSDGVRFLAARGTIDPARVCIVGASYGGYAALAGATLDAGVYRCAASLAGPSDLVKMVALARFQGDGSGSSSVERYWLRYMGSRADLASISPAYQAAKVKVPVLLIHGKDDTVVPFDQSVAMADALHRAGREVEFVTLRKEDHWLSQGETRLQMLQAVVAFLKKNNPPD